MGDLLGSPCARLLTWGTAPLGMSTISQINSWSVGDLGQCCAAAYDG